MQAAKLLVDCLEAEGVEHVFGLPGEEMEDLLFALRDSELTFVPTRHEQGAAFMADVHGRLTGEAGVCLATLGPGATNLLTGVADAHLDKSPLVAITAQGGLERLHVESHQALDVVDMFGPVTKWNTQLNDPDIVHESVRKAFNLATYEKPGATHLELPEDVAAMETDRDPLPTRTRVRYVPPDRASLERLITELCDAERPVVVTGNGAVRARAADHLREFVEETNIPAVSTYMGKGAVSDADQRSLMTLDSGLGEGALEAIHRADLVISVGFDIAEHDPGEWDLRDTVLAHIDTEPAEVYEAYNPEVEIVADIGQTLREVVEVVGDNGIRTNSSWYDPIRERIVEEIEREPSATAPFVIRDILPQVREAMDPADVLISDVGSHKMAIAQNFPTYEPNTCLISNGLASMGIAVPGAVAADLAVDAHVVAATGDGGFLMNAAEIETASRLGCEFTILLFNDDDYGLISEKQEAHTGESFGTMLTNPDFGTFAESFGIDSYQPTTPSEIHEALLDSRSGGLSLVEVPIDS